MRQHGRKLWQLNTKGKAKYLRDLFARRTLVQQFDDTDDDDEESTKDSFVMARLERMLAASFTLAVTDSLGLPAIVTDEVVITVEPYRVYLPLIARY